MSTNVVSLPGHGAASTAARQQVASNLAAELARKRMSGRDAAKALNMGQMYVSRRVSGDVEMSVSDLIQFANLLQIDPAVLLNGASPSPIDPTKHANTVRPEGLEPPTLSV